MPGIARRALIGLSHFQFFPVMQDDGDGYEADDTNAISVPWAAQMTVSDDTSDNKFYGDDQIYLDLQSWNGRTLTVTFHEFELEMYAKFGFGTWDSASETLSFDPQSSNKQYAMTFRQLRADGSYLMTKAYNAVVTGITEAGAQTKSDSKNLNDVSLAIMIGRRRIDNVPMDVRDTAAPPAAGDLDWLDTIDKLPA